MKKQPLTFNIGVGQWVRTLHGKNHDLMKCHEGFLHGKYTLIEQEQWEN
jgi:hypothetical protein